MSSIIYLSKDGYDNLKNNLHQLKSVDRPNIINQISEARDKGDLSENAEYDAAKEAQGMLELQISRMEEALSNARIIDESKLDTSKVLILSTVEVKNITTNKLMKFTLVAQTEADLKSGKISVESPIGRGLLGKSVGEIAKILIPNGKIEFEIIKINRN